MILYTEKGDKIKCIKTERPKLNSRKIWWDKICGNIDNEVVKFWFTVKNNRSNFYFEFKSEWYKTVICSSEGLDLWNWIYERGKGLYSELK